MTITTTTVTRAAGVSAVAAGLLFIAVQIKHPVLELSYVTTTEWQIRQTMKVLFASLALAGITGMYLRQVKQMGVLGLLGYVLFAANFLVLMSIEIISLAVLPALADSAPGYVNDVLTVANGGQATGDIGFLQPLSMLQGTAGYLVGGLLFGVALLRTNVLDRWAAALLAASTVATLAIPLLPDFNQRLFAIPMGVALVGLGYSLWRVQRTVVAQPTSSLASAQLNPAGAK
jgi:hypothetical protein